MIVQRPNYDRASQFFFINVWLFFYSIFVCGTTDFQNYLYFLFKNIWLFSFHVILRILLHFRISCSIFLFIIKIYFRVIFSPCFQLNSCCIVYKRISLVILRCLIAKYIIAILFEVSKMLILSNNYDYLLAFI